jgi:cell division inhibitor SepF
MGVRDQLERAAAWFGFGVDEDDYYEEEEGRHPYAKERYLKERRGGEVQVEEPGPTVRRLGRSERSSAFGTSLGGLFGGEGSSGRDRSSYEPQSGSSPRLRAVPDQRVSPPARVSVVDPANFNDAQALADRFKRQQPVILNLQQANTELSRRMVDFCSGLTYALDGQIQSVANRVFLLTPRNVEVSAEERKRIAEQAFFNQL